MSFFRRGLAPLALLLATAAPAAAGELDDCLRSATSKAMTSQHLLVADPDLDFSSKHADLDAVPLCDLQPVADFHPETDRWTERTNRIKTSLLIGAWAPSGELRIGPTPMAGFRISWEVPGFIAIRWDSSLAPFAQLEVRQASTGDTEKISGYVHSHQLSLGIFNPELSIQNLAFWAGFGGGIFFYDFSETDVFVNGDKYSFDSSSTEDNFNISGHIFAELDYKIIDVLHIGLGLRYHLVLAKHTDAGRFYDVNGVPASLGSGRNNGQFDDAAGIAELTLQISIVW